MVGQLHSTTAEGNLQLLGDAAREKGATVLTTKSDQVSGMFFARPIDPVTSFRARLQFRLTAPSGGQGADGIALVFASELRLGVGGFGLGYDGIGREGDFAVEGELGFVANRGSQAVDTFCSYDHAEDPAVPHISLHSPPKAHHQYSIACTRPGAMPLVNDGRVYTLEAIYDARSRSVSAFLKIPGEGAKLGLWKAPVPPAVQGGQAMPRYVGVTAATGGLWQKVRGTLRP